MGFVIILLLHEVDKILETPFIIMQFNTMQPTNTASKVHRVNTQQKLNILNQIAFIIELLYCTA